MLLSQSALKIWNIYFIFIRMSDVGMFFCQRFFFPYERLSLPVSNNVDKYLKLSQIFGIGQFFFSKFFCNFWVQPDKNRQHWWDYDGLWNERTSKSPHHFLSLALSPLSLSLSFFNIHPLPTFPSFTSPISGQCVIFFHGLGVCLHHGWRMSGSKCFVVTTAPPAYREAEITENV